MEASEGQVCVALHGVRLVLSSESPEFIRYVKMAMKPFLTQPGTAPPNIVSELEWVEGPVAGDLGEAFGVRSWDRRPDRDVFVAGRRLWWLRVDEFPPFHVSASWDDGRLTVTGRYYFHLGRNWEWLRRLRHRRRLPRLRAHRFSTLLYYLVYYPIVWYLTRFEGLHLMHGAAVSPPDGGAVVFFGMPGCGKSTLAASLLADPEVRLLSDNLILYDARSVAACPELLLLDRASLDRLPPTAQERLLPVADRRVFERDAFRPQETVMERVSPRAAACVGRATRGELRRLSAEQCVRYALGGSRAAKEVRRFETMASVLDLIAASGGGDSYADLMRLLSDSPCYELWLSAGDDGGGVLERLLAEAD